MSGLDIHGGLRIWWEGLRPRFSAEFDDRVQAIADTKRYVTQLQDRVNMATAWLAAMTKEEESPDA